MDQKSILVVEDDAIVAIHLQNMLAGHGYSIIGPVATGEAAIEAVAASSPDLILMDIQLAGEMNGISAAERIHFSADVPVIFLTSYSQNPLPEQAKAAAPYGYLLKPVSPKELFLTIEMTLSRHGLDRQLRENEEELSAIYQDAPLVMMILDGKTKIHKVNKYITRFTDRPDVDMVGLCVGRALHCHHALDDPRGCGYGPHCPECTIHQVSLNTIHTGRSHNQVEARLNLSIGGKRQDLVFLVSTTGLIVRQEPLVLVSMQDITERKRMEAALQNSHDELERLVQERTSELVLANENLIRELEERERKEEVLKSHLRVSEFAVTHSLDDLLQNALDEVEQLTDSRIGFFHFLEEDQKTLSLQAWSKSTLRTFCTAEGKGRHCSVSEAGVWADCIGQRHPIIHNDYAGLPNCMGLPPGNAAVVRELVVPIIRDDRVAAILGVGNKEHDYDSRDVETASELANITWDIVLRKQAEEQLYNSNAKLTTIFNGITQPVIMLDADFKVERLNSAAKHYYSLDNYQDAIGRFCFEAFRGRSTPCDGCKLPFSSMQGYSGAFERPGGMDPDKIEKVFVDVVKDESGALKATIIRISDITQAKLMDRQLVQSEKLASLGLLIAGIAHEINNPNNFIYFNLPILRTYIQFMLPLVDAYISDHQEVQAFGRPYPVFREDCFKLLDNIEHGSTRINQIVNNLREFVRERGKGEMRQIDLKQVIEKSTSICMGRIRKTVKNFEVTLPEKLPILVTDPLAVEQVVVNLLINALQAADKEDSWVNLTVSESSGPKGEVIIEVSDNGCGMDTETQRKIFDPFFTTKAVGVGTGLGLSISHRLVSELGGRLEVKSEAGKGSIFQLVLPAKL